MANGVAKRDGRKESTWRRHVRAQASGCLSVRAYCAARGLREYSFYWWRRELARRDVERVEPAFVPVEVTLPPVPAAAASGAVEIVLPGHRRVRVTGPVDRQQLVDVLAALEVHAGRQGNESC